jgi:hypothetical protein
MATTLGETTPAVADQFGADGVAWSPGDDEVVALATVCAAGDDPAPVRVTAYVPPLARTAATSAMAPASASLRGLAG